jgi:hypothetical protein
MFVHSYSIPKSARSDAGTQRFNLVLVLLSCCAEGVSTATLSTKWDLGRQGSKTSRVLCRLVRWSVVAGPKLCRGLVPWNFVVEFCRGVLSWSFVVVFCRGILQWHFEGKFALDGRQRTRITMKAKQTALAIETFTNAAYLSV